LSRGQQVVSSIGQLLRRPGWLAGAVAAVVAAGIGAGLVSSASADAPGPAAVRAALVTRAAPPSAPAPASRQAAAIAAIVRRAMKAGGLRAVLVRVTEGGRVVASQAFGPSLVGQPATTAMHFRNGSVAFAYLGTLLMEYVDEHKVRLDDPVRRWLPGLPEAGQVTLRMLANQTTGYPDYENDPAWQAAYAAHPFRTWTYRQLIDYAFDRKPLFAPGKNWSYAHTNFMILGRILSMVGKKPLATLLRDKVLGPMGLTGTTSRSPRSGTSAGARRPARARRRPSPTWPGRPRPSAPAPCCRGPATAP
jgi:CubicO group peptidase (beta-lactamase class C family)